MEEVVPASPLSEKTIQYIAKQDAALNRRSGIEHDSLINIVKTLLAGGRVEVGWRESCGKTDFTMHVYRAWLKVLPKLEKDGLAWKEERVKHKNAYTTNHGGFWSSVVYELTPRSTPEARP